MYPIRLGDSGEVTWLRLAEVCNTASDHRVEQCPALVGPSEMARWRVSMDFSAGVTEIAGHVAETQLSDTRRPVLRVLPEGPIEAWSTPEMMALKETLLKDPYSLALLQQGPDEAEDTTEEEELAAPADPDKCRDLAMWQETMEDEAIMCLDHVLAKQGDEALLALAAPGDESASDGSISEGESETSHEDGPDEPSDGETDPEESREEANVLGADLPGDTEILNKGQRCWLLDAVQKVTEAAEAEIKQNVPREKVSQRRPGPWRILEIFTWTCALTQAACGWDLENPGAQEKAFRYLQEVDPDVVMVAWPCGPWSIMQNANMRTPQQREALHLRRMQSRRTLLRFTRRVVLWQRNRGRLVFGENPAKPKAWKTPEIAEAFSGAGQVDFDQCMLGLRHPTTQCPIRKRTRMRGETSAMKYLAQAQCDGSHQHQHIEGGFRQANGKWMSLSVWAGGYGQALWALLKGCEEWLRTSHQVYVEDDAMPEIVDGHEAL